MPRGLMTAALLCMLGLSACGSSDASPTTPAPTQPATTVVGSQISVTDADVADLEKQLDEIDQLLSGVDADLAHD